jgi:hypothetical protein
MLEARMQQVISCPFCIFENIMKYFAIATCCFIVFSSIVFASHSHSSPYVTISTQSGEQRNRVVHTPALHFFSGRKNELKLELTDVEPTLSGIRISLFQLSSNLAIPLGKVYEKKGIEAHSIPFQLNLPEVKQRAHFELVTAIRATKNGPWKNISTTKVIGYPKHVFRSAKQYLNVFDFLIFDPTGNLQKLFSGADVPYTDFAHITGSLPQPEGEKQLLILCVVPSEKKIPGIEDDINFLKEQGDHLLLFKNEKKALSQLYILETETLYHVRADLSLFTNLLEHPEKQERLLGLFQLFFESIHKEQ